MNKDIWRKKKGNIPKPILILVLALAGLDPQHATPHPHISYPLSNLIQLPPRIPTHSRKHLSQQLVQRRSLPQPHHPILAHPGFDDRQALGLDPPPARVPALDVLLHEHLDAAMHEADALALVLSQELACQRRCVVYCSRGLAGCVAHHEAVLREAGRERVKGGYRGDIGMGG